MTDEEILKEVGGLCGPRPESLTFVMSARQFLAWAEKEVETAARLRALPDGDLDLVTVEVTFPVDRGVENELSTGTFSPIKGRLVRDGDSGFFVLQEPV